jgi:hypothetical protein
VRYPPIGNAVPGVPYDLFFEMKSAPLLRGAGNSFIKLRRQHIAEFQNHGIPVAVIVDP